MSAAAKQRTASIVLSASRASAPSASSVARDPRPQVVPHLAAERGVQQVFGVARLAAILGDEPELVLDQREEPVVAERHRQRRRLVERGLSLRRGRRPFAWPRRGRGAAGRPRPGAHRLGSLRSPARGAWTQRRRRRWRARCRRGSSPLRRTARPLPDALARAISASSPAAASARSPVAARGSRDQASVNPPVDGSPTARAQSAPCSNAGVCGCELAPVRREVTDLGVVPGEEEPALERFGHAPELVERLCSTRFVVGDVVRHRHHLPAVRDGPIVADRATELDAARQAGAARLGIEEQLPEAERVQRARRRPNRRRPPRPSPTPRAPGPASSRSRRRTARHARRPRAHALGRRSALRRGRSERARTTGRPSPRCPRNSQNKVSATVNRSISSAASALLPHSNAVSRLS